MTANDRLTAKQAQAVAALVAEPNARRAAQRVGISERTLNRWRQREAFREAHEAASRAVWDDALRELRAAQLGAVQALRDALTAPVVADRVRAARALLDVGMRAADADLERRLQHLEEAWTADASPLGSPALRLAGP